jgi:hypothetical protein
VTFTYTGSAQTWTVPENVLGDISFTITSGGGGGGAAGGGSNGEGGPGGNPATVTGELTRAQAGDVISVIVGGGGAGGQLVSPTSSTVMAGGWGGAGSGGSVSAPEDVGYGQVDFGGGGGGMSAISSASACSSGTGDYCAIAGGGGGGGASSGSGDVTIWGAQGGNAGSAGATSTTNGDCASYGITTSSGFGNGGAAGSAGAAAPGSSFGTGVTDPGPTGTGGGGGGGAAGGSVGNGGVVEDGCVIGGGGGGGASYIDTTDTTSAVASTAPSGGGAAVQVYAGGPGSNGAKGEVSFTYTLGVPPTITSATSATFTEGQSGTTSFTASGTPTPTWNESGALPAGVSFADNGGGDATLSGAPTQFGAYPITLVASNGMSPEASETFTLYVDAPPSISEPSTSAMALAGQSMTPVDFTASGYPAPTFSESGPLPTGVSLSSSGVLSGRPTQGGLFPITVSASNTVGSASSTSFTLTVDEAPSITSSSSTTCSVGSTCSVTVQASGYPTPTLSLSPSSTLPSGLSLTDQGNGTATISGTPASGTGGSYQLGISASSSAGSAAQTFNLVVDSKATFTSPATIALDAGTSVSFQITTIDGYPAPSLTATALPAGLSLTDQGNGTALLTGSVQTSAEGTYHPVFGATSLAGTVSQGTTLSVQAPGTAVSNCPTGDICSGGTKPVAPTITSGASTTFLVGAPGSYQIVATGTPAPTCTETGTLPSGVTLSSACLLSGAPTTAGTFTITVTAANGQDPSATQAFTLTVTALPSSGGGGGAPSPGPAPSPPLLGSGQGAGPGTVTFTEGTSGSFQIPASGIPTPTCTLASGSLPPGLSLSSSCLISGSPTKGGTYAFTVEASNASGFTTETLTLSVQPPKVVVVPPSGPDYHFSSVLSGALHYKVASPASLNGTRMATSGKVLLSLTSDFGFDGRGGLGSVHLVLQRDLRTVRVQQVIHGHERTVERRVAFYAGVLVLVEPEHRGALVFRHFTDVRLIGKTVHAVAVGQLISTERVRVLVKVNGREQLVWRNRQVKRPLRFAFATSPSTS